jgi:hypothetical protein
LSASRRATGAVTDVLSKECVVSLHSARSRYVAISHRAPDHIKAILPLIQPKFVIGSHGDISEVNSAPFDIKDPIRRCARHRSEHAASSTRESRAPGVCVCALVIPVREDGVVVGSPWQANISKGSVRSRKLRIAVG